MADEGSLAGLVLAGGYSRRFGDQEKALAELEGTTMIEHVVEALAAVTDDVVVNCRAEQKAAIADALATSKVLVRFALDPVPDRGPVAGTSVGLDSIERPYAAVVACDMPFVDPTLLTQLQDTVRGYEAAVVERDSGRVQPVQAVYRVGPTRRACLESLEDVDSPASFMSVLERLDVRRVSESELADVSEHSLESIDTQTALRRAERWIEDG